MGERGWPKCVRTLGWFKCVGRLGWLELALPTALTCLCKVRLGILSKTLSHIWGKLNLPIYLFKVGLFSWINMDSLIFLPKPCPSLPIIWKFCWVVGWPVLLLWWCIGEGSFQVLLESFTKGPRGFPYAFIIASKVTTLEPVYGPTFVDHRIFVPGETSTFLVVLLPLKWVCIPYLPQIF